MPALPGTHELSARSSCSKKEWFSWASFRRASTPGARSFLIQRIEAIVTPPKATSAAELARAAAAKRTNEPAKSRVKRRFSMSVVNFWVDATILAALSLADLGVGRSSVHLPGAHARRGLDSVWPDLRPVPRYPVRNALHFCLGNSHPSHAALELGLLGHRKPDSHVTAERPDEGMQTIYGVATLMVLLHVVGAGLILALFFVHRPPPA